KTKPLPKVNAVAREIRVRVTGARAGSASGAGERELFSESTATVLVFEKGGVIGLTAAVTPGQLLFLTNEESKREVVAQVIRKRAHRPTGCFAELEFTEPASGFWGIEFSAATPLLPKDSSGRNSPPMYPPPKANQGQATSRCRVRICRRNRRRISTSRCQGRSDLSAHADSSLPVSERQCFAWRS